MTNPSTDFVLRPQVTEQLLAQLNPDITNYPLVRLYGPSGVGKTLYSGIELARELASQPVLALEEVGPFKSSPRDLITKLGNAIIDRHPEFETRKEAEFFRQKVNTWLQGDAATAAEKIRYMLNGVEDLPNYKSPNIQLILCLDQFDKFFESSKEQREEMKQLLSFIMGLVGMKTILVTINYRGWVSCEVDSLFAEIGIDTEGSDFFNLKLSYPDKREIPDVADRLIKHLATKYSDLSLTKQSVVDTLEERPAAIAILPEYFESLHLDHGLTNDQRILHYFEDQDLSSQDLIRKIFQRLDKRGAFPILENEHFVSNLLEALKLADEKIISIDGYHPGDIVLYPTKPELEESIRPSILEMESPTPAKEQVITANRKKLSPLILTLASCLIVVSLAIWIFRHDSLASAGKPKDFQPTQEVAQPEETPIAEVIPAPLPLPSEQPADIENVSESMVLPSPEPAAAPREKPVIEPETPAVEIAVEQEHPQPPIVEEQEIASIVEKEVTVDESLQPTSPASHQEMLDRIMSDSSVPQEYKDLIAGADRLNTRYDLRFGSADTQLQLTTDSQEKFSELLSFLSSSGRDSYQVILIGFADSVGTMRNNRKVSLWRAEAVGKLLREKGFTNVKAAGLGEALPIADNASAAGRETNRRVEIWLKRN